MQSVILMGVGHSGTTVLARMYHALGWRYDETDEAYRKFCEWRWCVPHTGALTRFHRGTPRPEDGTVEQNVEALNRGYAGIAKPAIVKDPRFVLTLHLLDFPDATLVWLQRDIEAVARSFARRKQFVDGKPGLYGATVFELFAAARREYAIWKGDARCLRYEDVADAVSHNDVQHLGALLGVEDASPAMPLFDAKDG